MPVPGMRSLFKVASLPVLAAFFLNADAQQSSPVRAESVHSSMAMSDASMPMPQVAPLFIENGYFTTTLVLLNAAATHTFADVVLRATNGRAVVHKRIEFQPNSQRQIQMQELLREIAFRDVIGSVELSSDNNGVIVGQLAITYQPEGGDETLIDEEFAMAMHSDSGTLRGLSSKSSSAPLLSLANLEAASQNVKVTCLSDAG